jgi:hypothetical protein
MPLYVATVVTARRGRPAMTTQVTVAAPPIWWLLAEEVAMRTSRTWARLVDPARRGRVRHHAGASRP